LPIKTIHKRAPVRSHGLAVSGNPGFTQVFGYSCGADMGVLPDAGISAGAAGLLLINHAIAEAD